MDQKQLIINRYNVIKNNWHKMNVILVNNKENKKGLIKILNGTAKEQIFPAIKLPDIIFTKLNKINDIKELNNLLEFNIYFKTKEINVIQTYSINLNIKTVKIIKVDEREVRREVDLWRLRRLYNLDFINYYLDELYIDFDPSFVDKLKSEYKLFNNMNLLDRIFKNNNKISDTGVSESFDILYLNNESIQHETNTYTIRSQNFVKYLNEKNSHNKVCIVTKLGSCSKNINLGTIHDTVHYFKIGCKEDESLNLINYIQKYMDEIIKLCIRLKIKIIHACSNYLNGIVAICAARHLNLKTIYEIRDFQDEMSYLLKPEIYESDLLKFRYNLENYVIDKCNKIIVPNKKIYDFMSTRNENITEECLNKITIIPDGIENKSVEINNNHKIAFFCLNKIELNLNIEILDSQCNFNLLTMAVYNESKYVFTMYKLMANGVIVFVPNTEEFSDIFNDICVLYNDELDLIEKITFYYNNDDSRVLLIKKMQNWILENMSWVKSTEYLDDVYNSIR